MWEAPSTAPPLIHRRMSLLHNPPSPLPVVSGIEQRSTSAQNYVQKKRIAQCTLLIEELQESISFVTTRALTFSDPYHQTNGNMRMKTNQFGTFDNTSDSQTALRTSNAPFQCLGIRIWIEITIAVETLPHQNTLKVNQDFVYVCLIYFGQNL